MWYMSRRGRARSHDSPRLSAVGANAPSAARALLEAGHWPSAYHLAGFAVECGLKACVAKQIRRYDFPPRTTANLYTHDPTKLLEPAKLVNAPAAAAVASAAFEVNWTTLKDWTPESRYDHSITLVKARDLYRAITARQNGVMSWIRQRW